MAIHNQCQSPHTLFVADIKPILKKAVRSKTEGVSLSEAIEQGLSEDKFISLFKSILHKNDTTLLEPFSKWDWINVSIPSSVGRVNDEATWIADKHQYKKLSAPLWVFARTTNQYDTNYGLEIKFLNHDQKEHTCNFKETALSTGGKSFWYDDLLSNGLKILYPNKSKSKKLLLDYINAFVPTKKATYANRQGWHNGQFLMPHKKYGKGTKVRTVLDSDNAISLREYITQGSLKEWTDTVGKYAQGNDFLMFSISLAILAPFIKHLSIENIGVHLYGESSKGKTTILNTIQHLWGMADDSSWNTTKIGAEGKAISANDSILLLDEIAEVNPRDLSALIYNLGNGQTKTRSNSVGKLQKSTAVTFAYLSSGELSLSDKLAQAGQIQTKGQAVRFLEFRADTRKYGVFDTIHDFGSAAEFVRQLKIHTEAHKGVFIDHLLSFVSKSLDKHVEEIHQKAAEINQLLNREEAEPLVGRGLDKFAYIAAAGEWAIAHQLLPWAPNSLLDVVDRLSKQWIESLKPYSLIAVIDRIYDELWRYPKKFHDWGDDTNPITNFGSNGLWGYRKEVDGKDHYYVAPVALREDWKFIPLGHMKELVEDLIKEKVLENHANLNENTGAYLMKIPALGKNRTKRMLHFLPREKKEKEKEQS